MLGGDEQRAGEHRQRSAQPDGARTVRLQQDLGRRRGAAGGEPAASACAGLVVVPQDLGRLAGVHRLRPQPAGGAHPRQVGYTV